MNDFMTDKEQKILDKIEYIHCVLNIGFNRGEIEKTFYFLAKKELDELFKMTVDKFEGEIK